MSTDDGSCCGELHEPVREQPPGLADLAVRTDGWAGFRRRMLEALPVHAVELDPATGVPPGTFARPLAALTTRSVDDDTIALVDAWACACEVLAFYGERLLEEGYLGTAKDRRSLVELARAIGYAPSPGVAASTRLAFIVDEHAQGGVISLPTGLPVLSVPGPGEQPQTFETVEAIEARLEWNRVAAARTRRQHLVEDAQEVWLAGGSIRLAKGDAIALLGTELTSSGHDERWDFRFVAEVKADPTTGTTWVLLDRPLGDGFTDPAEQQPFAVVFRRRAGLFGVNAPNARMVSFPTEAEHDDQISGHQWKNFGLDADEFAKKGEIDLDREHEGILQGSFVVLQDGVLVELYRVKRATPRERNGFGLATKVTRVKLAATAGIFAEDLASFRRRATTVYIDSDRLELAEAPWLDEVSGATIELDRVVAAMPMGRTVIVEGSSVATGEPVTHVTTVAGWHTRVPNSLRVASRSAITLDVPLPEPLVRSTVVVHGNIALATHGTSIDEALGHGDAATPFQRMRLRQGPLTWTSAATATGRESTVQLTVDGIAWSRVEALFGEPPDAHVYELRGELDGTTTVQFGDGKDGARVPTGIENVRVRYRKGIGLGGEVGAHALTVLQRRPPGLRGVDNPLAAEGAADPERIDEIRLNAPLRVLTLDRLVSLQDYEDFARAFAGIGKARADELWDGKRSLVHVTVASASGQPLSSGSTTLHTLADAIAAWADPAHIALLSSYVEVPFAVRVDVLRDAAFAKDDVEAAVIAALTDAFSFARRGFGQAVYASEVVSAAQGAAGVRAIDLERLHRVGTTPQLHGYLPSARPRYSGGGVLPAELLVVSTAHIDVGWIEA